MTTKTLKPNAAVQVGKIVYWNISAMPCSLPLTQPEELSPYKGLRYIACPPGKWANPLGTNKVLTIVSLAK